MHDDRKALAVIRSYRDLHSFLRARFHEIAVTRELSDAGSGLPSGYTGKVLGPAMVKNIGPLSFGALLTMANVELVVVERDHITARDRRSKGRWKRAAKSRARDVVE